MAWHNYKSIRGNPTIGHGAPAQRLNQLFVRMLEVIAAITILLCLSPILLISSIAIKLDSGGPVLTRVTRRDSRNRPIQVLKFQVATACEPGENSQRLSGIGLVLTQTGIDELPQFLNVLRGEISFIEAVKPLL